jgi:hypothetical protein
MDEVALAATIGGSLVGLAGIGATAWSSWQQRESAKELAAAQQKHERQLASGARLFDRRAAVYEDMLRFLNVWMERVDATEKMMTFEGEPEPPEPPGPEEWRGMYAKLRTYGSKAVAEGYDAFSEAVVDFFIARVPATRTVRETGTDPEEAVRIHRQLEDARRKVREALNALERLVSEELAAL